MYALRSGMKKCMPTLLKKTLVRLDYVLRDSYFDKQYVIVVVFQNVLVTSQGALGGSQTVLLASQGLSSSALRSQQPQALTVLQQGNQQILLPPGFHASALNLKALQGLKVIPITPTTASKGAFSKC